jgi:hypothetical protein
LFAGNEVGAENWALRASIVATCKLNNVDAVAYTTQTLQAKRLSAANTLQRMSWRRCCSYVRPSFAKAKARNVERVSVELTQILPNKNFDGGSFELSNQNHFLQAIHERPGFG